MRYRQQYFYANYDEFEKYIHKKYEFLTLHKNIGEFEKIYGFMNDMADSFGNKCVLIDDNPTHGGFIPLHCARKFQNVILLNIRKPHDTNIQQNISIMKIGNVSFELSESAVPKIYHSITESFDVDDSILVIKSKKENYSYIFQLDDYYIHIPDKYISQFNESFRYYFNGNNFEYNNLINMVVMVKNGGELFKKMLIHNEPFIDRWTILDTGSTDGTQDVVKEIMKNKKGKLYEGDFINYRESINHLIELSGYQCKFNVVLDDTYLLGSGVRQFLMDVRNDVMVDSFSLMIMNDDIEYGLNRISKSVDNIKHTLKIHEIIREHNDVLIPDAYINDITDDNMRKRPFNAKQYDIELFNKMIYEEPDNPSHLYYLGKIYILLGEYDNAVDYLLKCANHKNEGILHEKIDAYLELARLSNFKLNVEWEKCEELYLKAYELDKKRPESLYFIGLHHYTQKNFEKAYKYLKQAYEIGYPTHTRYLLKPSISYSLIPKHFVNVCYVCQNLMLGKEICEFFFRHNSQQIECYQYMQQWYNIYMHIVQLDRRTIPKLDKKDILCFVADGGFSNWTGKDILTKGVGGSETHVIEMARYIKKHSDCDVYVFCKCDNTDMFEGVVYKPLRHLTTFVMEKYVKHCIVSRFSEYLPMLYEANTENIYFFVHDITPIGNILVDHLKLKNIFCLTEWHKNIMSVVFPTFKNKITYFEYGIAVENFGTDDTKIQDKTRFIYSSFPNRGLLELLQMWEKIIIKIPNAELHIYCDVDGQWVNNNYPEYMKCVKEMLEKSKQIVYHGWVNKQTLADGWMDADVWLYPCIFEETFCLTALESALSKTLCITNGLAALENTVGDRGICVEGNPKTEEWQTKTIEELVKILNDDEHRTMLINKNYEWARNMSWENRAIEFVNKFVNISILEHKGMYNWTNFRESIETFSNYLYEYKKLQRCEILEIGTYTGVSIINMLYYIENSHATVIDKWKNYIEQENTRYIEQFEVENSFYKNINTVGMNDRITVYKGQSFDKLLQLYKENKTFDVIYVDGSHMLFDAYVDTITSWKLLNKNGLMILDDYYFNYKKNMTLDCPKHGIDYFLESLPRSHYSILNVDIRVFIKKLV